MTLLPPLNLWSYRRFLEELFDMTAKTLCANSQKCINHDCLRHPKLLADKEREKWQRFSYLDYHYPPAGILCQYRKEEPK